MPAPSPVIQLSVTTKTSPGNMQIHTLQQLFDADANTKILDNLTLDTIPVLKYAIDQAFNRFDNSKTVCNNLKTK
jgi:hypothetical protein